MLFKNVNVSCKTRIALPPDIQNSRLSKGSSLPDEMKKRKSCSCLFVCSPFTHRGGKTFSHSFNAKCTVGSDCEIDFERG